MYPSVKRQIPEFIEEYLVYCDCFVDINKQKSCWVLTKNLKFFEFCQKQLVATIDLQTSCLSKLKTDFQNYNGPKGKWYNTTNVVPPIAKTQNEISLGKYVFHVINIYKIYVIIQCWSKCVVLKRLPDFKGFEIKAEYENLQGYRIIHGTIKFCPIVEFKFQNNETIKTDFEDQLETSGEHCLYNTNLDMRQVLERIRSAKTELQLHKTITAQSFYTIQNNLTVGQPSLRLPNLEEKQILSRCGDIWKRFTAYDDLVIGVPLVNQCSPPNFTIIRNLMPVLQTNQLPENSVQLYYRLFQLKLKFDQLDELETFLETEDEQMQGSVWCDNGDLQILPESFVVLLIKFKISQIICLKESPLILKYDVVRHLHTASDTINSTFCMPLQLFLQNFDFHKLLFEQRASCEVQFSNQNLHQDFLTIAMTSTETNINIIFKSCDDLVIFEHFLQKTLDFSKTSKSLDRLQSTDDLNLVFYNKKTSSWLFGCLMLRMKDITGEDNEHCVTKWKIYCQNFDKTLLLIKMILNDHLALNCNIISISNSIINDEQNSSKCAIEFENALRQELQQLRKVVSDTKCKNYSQDHITNLEKLCQLQFNSDILAGDLKEKNKCVSTEEGSG